MKRPLVILVHGVNHGPGARASYGGEWAGLLADAGFDVDVVALAWSSLDSFLLDGAASFYLGPKVMEGHLDELLGGFEGSPGLTRAVQIARAEHRRRIVLLTHSWGCVLGYLLKARYRWLADVPMVAIGSPHTHQTLGAMLRWRSRVPVWPKDRGPPPVFVSNRDDKICSLSRWLPTLGAPAGADLRWASADDGAREGLTQEHEPWQYIATEQLQGALVEAGI